MPRILYFLFIFSYIKLNSYGDNLTNIPIALYNQNKLVAKTLVSFESDSLSNFVPVGGTADIFVVKYDTLGVLKWIKGSGGNKNDEALAICAFNLDDFYITGAFASDSINYGATAICVIRTQP